MLNALVLVFLVSQCCISISQLHVWASDLKIENVESSEKNESEEKEEKKEKEDKWHQSDVNTSRLASIIKLSPQSAIENYGVDCIDITTPPPEYIS